jgi:hypothetical protein
VDFIEAEQEVTETIRHLAEVLLGMAREKNKDVTELVAARNAVDDAFGRQADALDRRRMSMAKVITDKINKIKGVSYEA